MLNKYLVLESEGIDSEGKPRLKIFDTASDLDEAEEIVEEALYDIGEEMFIAKLEKRFAKKVVSEDIQ